MFTIVPRRLCHQSAEILVGGFWQTSRPPALSLTVSGRPRAWCVDAWNVIDGGRAQPIFWWSARLDDLAPSQSHDIALLWGSEELATARLETLPASLPLGDTGTGAARPFTLWLSSCFSARHAQDGLAAVLDSVFASPRSRPHLKCLVGDQVYLDELSLFIYTALTSARLRSRFNTQYAYTFTHPEFSRLLSAGASVFLADDHELWNNYPHDPFGIPLRSHRFWRLWLELAYHERCVPLQAPSSLEVIDIGDDLSICVADTRMGRTADCSQFMTEGSGSGVTRVDGDLDRLVAWIEGLTCPGVLVTQQPILSARGSRSDRKLPDYGQYWSSLLPALHRCPQDLVILSGDVHHGHVATTLVGPENHTRQLIQVVSSPLALVSPIAASTSEEELDYFPSEDGRSPARPIAYPLRVPTYRWGRSIRSEEHAMTISFWRREDDGSARGSGRNIGMRVRTWLARSASSQTGPSWETTLHRHRSASAT